MTFKSKLHACPLSTHLVLPRRWSHPAVGDLGDEDLHVSGDGPNVVVAVAIGDRRLSVETWRV